MCIWYKNAKNVEMQVDLCYNPREIACCYKMTDAILIRKLSEKRGAEAWLKIGPQSKPLFWLLLPF
jgi:hypothetical protein